jgi:peroxiredoxin
MDVSVVASIIGAGLTLLVVAHTFVLIGLIKMVRELQGTTGPAELDGEIAPPFEVRDLRGEVVSKNKFLGRPFGLIFVSPDCDSCSLTLAELRAVLNKADGQVALFCRGSDSDCQRLAAGTDIEVPIIADGQGRIASLYGVTSVPTAVMIDATGRIVRVGHPEREAVGQLAAEN